MADDIFPTYPRVRRHGHYLAWKCAQCGWCNVRQFANVPSAYLVRYMCKRCDGAPKGFRARMTRHRARSYMNRELLTYRHGVNDA